jgi:hypothetical protein
MRDHITPAEARDALAAVDRGRREVLNEMGLPGWYWWSLALGWVALGIITDLGHPWLSAAGTVVFGAAHAAAFGSVAHGRRRSERVSIGREVVGRRAPFAILGSLLVLVAVTIAASVLAASDGARHPVTMASILVGVIILLGGPMLMGRVRRAASRSVRP